MTAAPTPIFTLYPTVPAALLDELRAHGGASIRVNLAAAAAWGTEPDESGLFPVNADALVHALVSLAGAWWPLAAPVRAGAIVTVPTVSAEHWADELLVGVIQAVAAVVATAGPGYVVESEPARGGELRFVVCLPGTARISGAMTDEARRQVLGKTFEHVDAHTWAPAKPKVTAEFLLGLDWSQPGRTRRALHADTAPDDSTYSFTWGDVTLPTEHAADPDEQGERRQAMEG